MEEVACCSERNCAVVQMLRLAPPQEEQLLLVRKKHLRNLRELYNDRQRMNLQVRPPRLHSAPPRCCPLPACKHR